MRTAIYCCSFLLSVCAQAQINQFPSFENFDSVIAPSLPADWATSFNHSAAGDFTTTKSTPYSDSNAVLSANAAVAQYLISPRLDFTNQEADSLSFYERRSSSHNSGVLIEASTNGGTSFDIRIGDTLQNPGTTSYIRRAMRLSPALSGQSNVKLRWRVLGNGTGTSGTIRFDDITISARGHFDVSVQSITFLPQNPSAGESVQITTVIQNNGLEPFNRFGVDFYDDADNDSLPQLDELFSSFNIDHVVQPNDTIHVEATLTTSSPGQSTIIVVAALANDQNVSNNIIQSVLFVGSTPQSIIINEILYNPLPGNAEYVELYNRTPAGIDIGDWKLSDVSDTSANTNSHTISTSSLAISSGGYLVIASDSSIFRSFPYLIDSPYHVVVRKSGLSLNNNGDNVILADPSHHHIDSVHYEPSWNNPDIDDVSGKSLERINPSLSSNDAKNWSTSANALGGTPSEQNSLFTRAIPTKATISCSPNPFSPDGDGFQDVTMIQYNLPATVAVIRLRIYDSQGRLIRILADREPAGSHGEIIWDGFTDRREKTRMGIYVILLEALDVSGNEVSTVKSVVVVATKM